jgi:hypothetical protein
MFLPSPVARTLCGLALNPTQATLKHEVQAWLECIPFSFSFSVGAPELS